MENIIDDRNNGLSNTNFADESLTLSEQPQQDQPSQQLEESQNNSATPTPKKRQRNRCKTQNRRGRPVRVFTEDERNQATYLYSIGLTQAQIAKTLKTSEKTLRKGLREELDAARMNADKAVLETLFSMATSGKCASATIFWAKTRCQGFSLVKPPKPPKQQQQPKNQQQQPQRQSREKTSHSKVPAAAPPKLNPRAVIDPAMSQRGPILRPLDTTKHIEFEFYCNDGEPNAEY